MTYHDDTVPMRHMRDHLREALAMAEGGAGMGRHPQSLLDGALAQAITMAGDAASRVMSETRCAHPGIPWRETIERAERLRRDYDQVDHDELRRLAREQFPAILGALDQALARERQRRAAVVETGRRVPVRITVPRERLAEFCRRHHIRKLSLFGSVLRDDFTTESDVDVLVDFEPGHTPGLAFFSLQDELASILGRPVDLHTEKSISPYMRDRVLAQLEEVFVGG